MSDPSGPFCPKPVVTPRGSFRPAVTAGLAALAAPRVVLHDLDVIDEGDVLNLVLVFGPPLVWIAVALACRIPNPLRALVWVGGTYGVMLAGLHQVLWDHADGENPPSLGGNLEGTLPATVEEIVIRGFAAGSGVLTGLAVGAISGIVAQAVMRTRGRW